MGRTSDLGLPLRRARATGAEGNGASGWSGAGAPTGDAGGDVEGDGGLAG